METIFDNNIESRLKSQPKLLLKSNAEFKKLNFGEVLGNSSLRVNSELFFKDKVTFIEQFNCYNTSVLNDEITEKIKGLKGFNSRTLRLPEIVPTGVIKWEVEGQLLGYYHKERNYFLSYYSFISDNAIRSNGEKNEIVPFFIDLLKKFFEENPVEVVDTSNIGKKIIAEKFNEVWIKKQKDLSSRITSETKSIADYTGRLKCSYDNIKLHKTEIINVEQQLGNGLEKIAEIIEKLENYRFIKSVEIDGSSIVLEYGDISIKHRGRDIYIGDFIAKITTGHIEIINRKPIEVFDSESDIKKENVQRIIHHPHISGSNTEQICFGSARDVDIAKFKSNLDYDKVGHLIFLFLKTYTESDGGYERIYPWIHAQENGDKRAYIRSGRHNDSDGEVTD